MYRSVYYVYNPNRVIIWSTKLAIYIFYYTYRSVYYII